MGYALARAGLRVLFCEKGRSHLGAADVLRGEYPELLFPRPAVPGPQHRDLLLRAGRWTDPLEDGSQVRSRSFVPFLGAGTGGSSALYGMALERFAPSDFVPREHHPDAREALLPKRWPISYADLAPYYAQAERLYRVRGTPDPLRRDADGQLPAPPALTGAGRALFDFLAGNGLHPYRLPLACEFVSGCNGCQGYLCGRNCKNDGGRICIEPALREHGASLLERRRRRPARGEQRPSHRYRLRPPRRDVHAARRHRRARCGRARDTAAAARFGVAAMADRDSPTAPVWSAAT